MADTEKTESNIESNNAEPSWKDKLIEKAKEVGSEIAEGVKDEMKTGLDDIRHKVVEEPWFGTEVTENHATVESSNLYGPNINDKLDLDEPEIER